jgi:hypothetical protein
MKDHADNRMLWINAFLEHNRDEAYLPARSMTHEIADCEINTFRFQVATSFATRMTARPRGVMRYRRTFP